MTREELIEVIRNKLWRQVFARDENAETMLSAQALCYIWMKCLWTRTTSTASQMPYRFASEITAFALPAPPCRDQP